MTILDLAESCHPRLSHNEAKRIAFEKVSRLRACDWRVAELEPCEVAKLRLLFQAAAELKAKGPELPGLTPGPAPQVFLFDKWRVRVAVKEGRPWFVARDVLEALGYDLSNIGNKINHVPENWRGRYPIATPSAEQEMLILSLEGLFYFLNRSDKPAAKPFQEWVNGEVLVSIHETGAYKVPGADKPKKPAAPKLPAGVQLKELRLMGKEGILSARQIQRLLGVEEILRIAGPEEPPLSLEEAEARFKELRGKVGAE
ncbi:MAG: Bro-N domain-containing protein [Methylacidiphilaceae bacterium]|nr:Bro-N domain-containing protein [Candidatus Methylacidiphilaceae bacterium]